MIDDEVTRRADAADGEDGDEEATLDGNAAAGALQAVFGREMTLAVATCDACGTPDDIGGLVAYIRAPGIVLRCRSCDNVLLRVVHARGRYWIDLRGVRSLRIDDDSDATVTPAESARDSIETPLPVVDVASRGEDRRV